MLCKIRLIACAILASLALIASAFDLPTGVTRGPSVEGINEYQLNNGLRVVMAQDASKPTSTVNITYLVGSRHENYGETGMAHLLEHLIFKGTPTYDNVFTELSKRGMNFNGTTWLDRTNYYESFSASDANLEWTLRMEADRMVNSFIAKKDLDSEMTVVRNEMEQGENNPFRILLERMQAAAYQWHNYGKSTIGARADVENVNIERLQAFYRSYYQPDNAVLVVAGRFDEAKTLSIIAQTFGKIPRPQRSIAPTYTLDPVQDGERMVTLRRVADTQYVAALYHVVPGSHTDYAAIEVLAEIMGDTPTGRLHKSLVESKLAAQVFGFSFSFKEPGLLFFGAQVRKEAALEPAQNELLKQIENSERHNFTAQEIERARNKLLKDIELTLNDPERLGVALSEAIALGDWRMFFLHRDRVRKVSAEDVRRVAATYLKPANRTLGLFIPTEKPERAAPPQKVDVTAALKDYRGDQAVSKGERFDATPENIDKRTERATLANGMKYALLPKTTRGNTVTASIRLHFGDERSVFGKSAVGSFTAAMLNKGTKTKTREQIAETWDRLKATVNISGGATGVNINIETVRSSLSEVLSLISEILRQPNFPVTEFEQLKNARLAAIENARREPQALASNSYARHFNRYPKGDIRYASTFEEQITDIQALKLEQLSEYYREFYGASFAELALVGDFDAAEIKQLLNRLFGDWQTPKPYLRVPRPYAATEPRVLKLETPDKANAFLLAGMNIPIQDTAADYPAFALGNYILGGTPQSRLFIRLRQKDGLSYGAGSSLQDNAYEPNSSLLMYAITAPENMQQAQTALREELQRLLKEGITSEELKDAKTSYLQSRSLERAQDLSLVSELTEQLLLKRNMRFDAEFDAKLANLSSVDVEAALRKYLDLEKLVFVMAGDFAKK